jgi:hypothetical protein
MKAGGKNEGKLLGEKYRKMCNGMSFYFPMHSFVTAENAVFGGGLLAKFYFFQKKICVTNKNVR